jgi:hypothetical protein
VTMDQTPRTTPGCAQRTTISSPKKPVLPVVGGNGCYDPGDLLRYLSDAKSAGMMDHEIARHLNVKRDELSFWQRPERLAKLRQQAMANELRARILDELKEKYGG